MLEDNPTVVRELFNNNQIRELREFANFADRVTSTKRAALNPSGTAAALRRFQNRLPYISDVVNFVVQPAMEGARARQIRELLTVDNIAARSRFDPDLLARTLALTVAGDRDE